MERAHILAANCAEGNFRPVDTSHTWDVQSPFNTA